MDRAPFGFFEAAARPIFANEGTRLIAAPRGPDCRSAALDQAAAEFSW